MEITSIGSREVSYIALVCCYKYDVMFVCVAHAHIHLVTMGSHLYRVFLIPDGLSCYSNTVNVYTN